MTLLVLLLCENVCFSCSLYRLTTRSQGLLTANDDSKLRYMLNFTLHELLMGTEARESLPRFDFEVASKPVILVDVWCNCIGGTELLW